MADELTFDPAPKPESAERKWIPMVVGLILVMVVIAAVVFFGRKTSAESMQADPYAAKLQVNDMRLSQADNFVGATVTYLDFVLANSGSQTVTGARVEAIFKNSLGEVAQKEVLPVRALVPNQLGGYPDLLDLNMSPIAPGGSKKVRLTLEHVSSDWNQAVPDLRFFAIQTK